MAKTLVDMTAEERANCVGMWAEMRSIWGIILGYEGKYVKLLCPTPERVRSDRELVVHVHVDLTRLLPDLPRAWTPDGEPVDGAWEKSTAELPTKDYKGTFTQHYRRWVEEWEQNNE